MSAQKPKCCETVWRGWRSRGCANSGAIERDGKFYCRTHDPVAVAEREKRIRERDDASFARFEVQGQLAAKRHAALKAIEQIARGLCGDARALANQVMAMPPRDNKEDR